MPLPPTRHSPSVESFDWKATACLAVLCFSCGGSGEGAGGVGGGDAGAGGAGGALACTLEFPRLAEDQIVRLAEGDWPGPLLLSQGGNPPEVSYVSLDEGGTARWLHFSLDSYDAGTAVWTTDGTTVVVTGNSDDPTWPNTYAADVTSVTLERVDERTVAAHLAGPAESRDEAWVPGGLCDDRCMLSPAYPCDFDFELSWSLIAPSD